MRLAGLSFEIDSAFQGEERPGKVPAALAEGRQGKRSKCSAVSMQFDWVAHAPSRADFGARAETSSTTIR